MNLGIRLWIMVTLGATLSPALAADAYTKAGIFKSCIWHTFIPYVGNYVGGWVGSGPQVPAGK